MSRARLETAASLRERHRAAARALIRTGVERNELIAFIDAQCAELEGLARGLAILRELTARTADFVVARGERLSARLVAAALAAAGQPTRYVDALEVVRTDGHFGNASPDLEATDKAMAKAFRPLIAKGSPPWCPASSAPLPMARWSPWGVGART